VAGGDPSHAERTPEAPEQGPFRPRSGRLLRRSTASLVVLLFALAAVSYQFDLGQKWLGWDYPSPVTEPAEVAPPPGLTLPAPENAPVVAEPTADGAADPAAVRRTLAGLVTSKKLGKHVAVAVDQLSDGSPVYSYGADLVTPASTMKLVTAAAALESLGTDHRFRTTVVAGVNTRQIVLVGGGDPLLGRAPVSQDVYPARADVRTLAAATAKALRDLGRTSIRIRYDDSLFTGPAVSPDWRPSYVPDNVVSPISALWVDEGRETTGFSFRAQDPAFDAARAFAEALARKQVKVVGRPKPAVAPADATELAAVESAPLAQVVQRILEVSDNEGAEVLFRHVAIAEGQPASFAGGRTAVTAVLASLGVDTAGLRILDGSGLSRDDRLTPDALLSVLELAASKDHPELRPVATDLPVAGFSGSLTYRFETGDDDGLGRVRAKTGTLTGVHGLAGLVTDLDGTEMVFVAIADRVKVKNTLAARALIDEVAAALAGCACGAAQGG
jgi:serine-type D-Ala-D-Ala carboxypeptidase/endopeptidase (penicillin-binding protein 4)